MHPTSTIRSPSTTDNISITPHPPRDTNMSADERKIAERMLMVELKELQEEKWVVAEVRKRES